MTVFGRYVLSSILVLLYRCMHSSAVALSLGCVAPTKRVRVRTLLLWVPTFFIACHVRVAWLSYYSVVFNSDTRYLVYITCPFSYSGTLCCCSGLFFLLLVSIIVYPFSYSMPTNRCLCLVFGPLFQTASTFSKRKRREKLLIACEIKKYLKSHQCAWYKVCRFFKCSTKSDSFCTQRFRYLQQ